MYLKNEAAPGIAHPSGDRPQALVAFVVIAGFEAPVNTPEKALRAGSGGSGWQGWNARAGRLGGDLGSIREAPIREKGPACAKGPSRHATIRGGG